MTAEGRSDHATRGQIVRRQGGVISRPQLVAVGWTNRQVDLAIDRGVLIPRYPNVYAYGHDQLRPHGRRSAALLACGDGALLSHRSAAAARGLLDDARQVFDVTVPRRSQVGGHIDAIRLHRRDLPATDVTTHDGLRVTTVARTLLDLAATEPPRRAHRAVNEALVQNIYDQAAMDDLLHRCRGHRGVARLRLVLDERHPDAHRTRSELERLALEKLRAADLPDPEVNATVRGLEVDLLWRDHKLVVELDGRRFHAHRRHVDRERDVVLTDASYEVHRFGWGEVAGGSFVAALDPNLRPSLSRPGSRQPIHTA
jgi:very-short-patch-repair endonuclease